MVTLDQELTFSENMKIDCRTCFCHLRPIRFLTTHAATTLMHAFILIRIDYCNVIYIALNFPLIYELQSVLNTSVRLIGGIPKVLTDVPVFCERTALDNYATKH